MPYFIWHMKYGICRSHIAAYSMDTGLTSFNLITAL
jgi:hypothetical protein